MRIAAALLALAACGDNELHVDNVDAGPPPSVLGRWAVEWECVGGCLQGNVNPLRYTTHVEVGELSALFTSEVCGDCDRQHTGWMESEETCFVSNGSAAERPSCAAYSLCAVSYDTMDGELTFSGYPGPPEPRTWRVSGVRVY
jgi:hypothetical protein